MALVATMRRGGLTTPASQSRAAIKEQVWRVPARYRAEAFLAAGDEAPVPLQPSGHPD